MKHYFLRIKKNKFIVVDTLDLTEEEAEFCDIVPHITDSFINAYYSPRDLSKEYEKGISLDKILPALKTPAYSAVNGHFVFDIKQGYVSYNGLYMEIYFYGERHIIQPAYTGIKLGGYNEKLWFILADKIILNKVQGNASQTDFRIRDIFVEDNRLLINISVAAGYKFFQIVLDYDTRSFHIRTIRGTEKGFPLSISDYLKWSNLFMKDEVSVETIPTIFASPDCVVNILESYFAVDVSLKKEEVLPLVDTILDYIQSGTLEYKEYKRSLELIDLFVGLSEKQKVRITKVMFMKGGT